MSVPVQNIPIALKNVVTTFEGFSGSSDLILSTITVFPGTQPETEGGFVRNWNFVISGALTSPEPISTFTIHMDLSKVSPTYLINFQGPMNGTLQIAKKSKNKNVKLYSTFQYVAFVSNNITKSIQLIVTVPCPSKNFYFNIDSYVADSGAGLNLTTSSSGTLVAGCTFLGYSYDSSTHTITLTSLVCIARNWYGACGTKYCDTQNTGDQSFFFQFNTGANNTTIFLVNNTGSGFNNNQILVNYIIGTNTSTTITNTTSSCNFNATMSSSSWTKLTNCGIVQ